MYGTPNFACGPQSTPWESTQRP